ncbi:MAG TPA: polysaccharide biosynthesis/export family protein [Planctomycetota bacterium]|nr:polysaccharide biosynthesis/export family protein [Planctomycetota bacterium]
MSGSSFLPRPRWPRLLVCLASALPALGCIGSDSRYRQVRPDTVPSEQGKRILASYTAERRPEPTVRRPVVTTLPVDAPPAVSLPGKPDRPWDGPPRSLGRDEVAPAPIPAPLPAPTPVPAPPKPLDPPVAGHRPQTGLLPGDTIDVQVERHPEFSGRWRVRSDGLLDIPEGGAFVADLLPGSAFARRVGAVDRLDPEQAGKSIAGALRSYLVSDPVVKVTQLTRRGD